MKAKIFFILSILTGLLAVTARAADPTPAPVPAESGPAATVPPCEPAEAVVPKRNLAFDQSDEEYAVETYYVGSAAGGMPGGMPGMAAMGGTLVTSLVPKDVPLLVTSLVPKDVPLYVAVLNLRFKFAPTQGGRPMGAFTPEQMRFHQQVQGPQSELLRLLVSQTPQERLPSKEILFELTQNADVFVRPSAAYGGDPFSGAGASANTFTVPLQVLAPTPQRAKEYAATLLTLYDYGLSYPFYCEIQRLPSAYSASLAKSRKELSAAKTNLARLEEELVPFKSFEDITQQSIGNLVSQQRMVEVDLAGITARIEACDKLLAKQPAMPANRSEQVETVKISAEIELVGLAARKAAIERLVTNGRRRIELEGKTQKARTEVARWQAESDRAAIPIEAARIAREEKLPFAQVQGKVLVRRVKWLEPSRPPRPSMGGMGGLPAMMTPGMPPGMMSAPGAGRMPGSMPGAASPRRATGTPQSNAPTQ